MTTTPAEKVLSLVRHRRTGPHTWMFHIPTRDDKHPSGTLRELEDGTLLLHDFGGDSTAEILAAIGLDLSDLYPEKPAEHHPPVRRAFPAADVLRAIGFEAQVVLCAASAVRRGEPLRRVDNDRLLVACERIQSALDLAGVSR